MTRSRWSSLVETDLPRANRRPYRLETDLPRANRRPDRLETDLTRANRRPDRLETDLTPLPTRAPSSPASQGQQDGRRGVTRLSR